MFVVINLLGVMRRDGISVVYSQNMTELLVENLWRPECIHPYPELICVKNTLCKRTLSVSLIVQSKMK